jgi:alkaline phosphatase D
VVIGGDVHCFNVSQLKLDFDDPASPVLASEFVGTSITSQAWSQERMNQYLPDNPHILPRREPLPRLRARRPHAAALDLDLRIMETVQRRDAAAAPSPPTSSRTASPAR